MTREQLASLAESYPVTQLGQAWGVSPSTVFKVTRKLGIRIGGGKWTTAAAQQRREWQALHAPPPRLVIKKPVPWSNPAKFLHQLWEIGAPKIARMYDCDHTILYDHANALGLPHPGRGYWQRRHREIPAKVLARMAQLDAEAADAERAAAAENSNPTPPPESQSLANRPASPPPAEHDSGPEPRPDPLPPDPSGTDHET